MTYYQNLSDDARMQFLVRALYNNKKRAPKDKIIKLYKEGLKVKSVDEERLSALIDCLVENGTLLLEVDMYYLPDTTISKLEQEDQLSKTIKDAIIEKYFGGTFSSKENIKAWLQIATVKFFDSFSNSWISDLSRREQSVNSKRDDIIKQIDNRTKSLDFIDGRDKKTLSGRFFEFITSSDPVVNNYLWEYGTTAFSVHLIKNTEGADELTLDLFENSICLLDTNVLIDIALETDEDHEALDVLSEIFEVLKVHVFTLGITRDEYLNKIASKHEEVSKLLGDNFRKLLHKSSDQFMQAARGRSCSRPEDYEAMFTSLGTVPGSICENVPIANFDEDQGLKKAIETWVNDDSIRSNYNSIYVSLHGKNKGDSQLSHDIGLLAASDYIAKSQKVFVLSTDSTLNVYAKQQPFEELPLAIRLDTLINILAVKKGAALNRMTSFQDLFANIIRSGFMPQTETFETRDLAYIHDKEAQVGSLDEYSIEEMARTVKRMRISDRPEKEILKYITRTFQGEKMKVIDDLDEMTIKFNKEREENRSYANELFRKDSVIEMAISEKAQEAYKKQFAWTVIWGVLFLLGIPLLIVVLVKAVNLLTDDSIAHSAIYIDIFTSVISDAIFGCLWWIPKVSHYVKDKASIIEQLKETISVDYYKKASRSR